MKSTGIRRKVDDLGRIVIPVGVRRSLGIDEGDHLEVSVEDGRVVLAKPVERCVVCDREDGPLQEVRGRRVCPTCMRSIAALAERTPGDDPWRPAPRGRPDRDYDPASTTAW